MELKVNNFIDNREISSIKDSFATRNMAQYGLEWTVVSTEEDLAKWTYASRLQKVLKPKLSEHTDELRSYWR